MAYCKYKLGDLVEQYDEINQNGEFTEVEDLQGINSNKYFQECKSNKNNIDLLRYHICRHGMFSYNRATSRNGEKISIALRTGDDCIVSPSYYCFRVKDEEVLCPEYLDIWFKRPVFDKYARFNSWGSATEFFTFDDFCATEIMLPPIPEQRKIVHDYQVITDRIELLRKINEKLYSYLDAQFERIVSDVTSFIPLSTLCDYVTDKEDFGRLHEQNYLSTENLLQNKQGIVGFGEAEDDTRVTCFQAEDTLISNIRPYFKKIWFATVSGGCNADVLCFRAHDSKDACLVNAILYQNKFFDYVMSGAKGTKMPRGDKSHIMQYPVPVLTKEKKGEFLSFADKIHSLQAVNKKEIDILQRLMVLSVSNIAKGA